MQCDPATSIFIWILEDNFFNSNFEYTLFVLFKSLGDSANVVGYGHLGDGNLHLNISTAQYDDGVISLYLNYRAIRTFSLVQFN